MKTAIKRAQRGFTLIEVLVVIGIILILLGMVVLGFRHLDAVASKRDTVAELHVCRGLLTEYENLNGLNVLEFAAKQMNGIPVYSDVPFPANVKLLDETAGGGVIDMSDRTIKSARYESPAVQKTQQVMRVLLRMPKNRSAVASLPTKRILEAEPAANGNTVPPDIGQAVILDGWGNPIIFVPRGGLHVMIDNGSGAQEYVVRTTGTYPYTGSDASFYQKYPLSPADRPFFASAGQDGKFGADPNNPKAAYGADNVYSFQD